MALDEQSSRHVPDKPSGVMRSVLPGGVRESGSGTTTPRAPSPLSVDRLAEIERLTQENTALAAKIDKAWDLIGRALLMHVAKAQPVDWPRWGRDAEAFLLSFPARPDDIEELRRRLAVVEPERNGQP